MLKTYDRHLTDPLPASDAQLANDRAQLEDPIEIVPEVGTWLVKFGSDVLEGFESLSKAVTFALDLAKRSASAPRVLVRLQAGSTRKLGAIG
jgi:hypothetical protein